MHHLTQVNLDVEITFKILEPLIVGDEVLPAMVELEAVYAELEKPDGKLARVNVLKVLSEPQRMLLEDEIIESLTESEQ